METTERKDKKNVYEDSMTLGEAFELKRKSEVESVTNADPGKSTRRHSSEVGVVGRAVVAIDESEDADGEEDPYDLRRFIRCQRRDFKRALGEIRGGEKRSCWMWYVIPTAPWIVDGREKGSFTNRRYALRDGAGSSSGNRACEAYLKTPFLRNNYAKIIRAVADQLERGVSCRDLMGFLDAPKLKSSVELFARTSRTFDAEVYEECTRVLASLKSASSSEKKSRRRRRVRGSFD